MCRTAIGINAFAADGTPTIKVYGNSVATAKDKTVNLNVRMSDFASVAGFDLKIEGTGITLGTPESNELKLTKNSNYVNDGKTIHIVELNSKKDTLNIKIPATVSGYETGKVKVTTGKLAANGKKLLAETTEYTIDNNNGGIAVVPENKRTDKAAFNFTKIDYSDTSRADNNAGIITEKQLELIKSAANGGKAVTGDANYNGEADITDLVNINERINNNKYVLGSDMNEDGNIDVTDIAILRSQLLN